MLEVGEVEMVEMVVEGVVVVEVEVTGGGWRHWEVKSSQQSPRLEHLRSQ